MDVRYINPFIASIKNLFSTMLDTEVLISKPFVQTGDELPSDATAVIGLSGDVMGSVALCFPMTTAVRAAGKFAGVELSENHEDFADALGEMANMVAGGAKAKLDGLNCSVALPNVVLGREHTLGRSNAAPRLVLPCDSALGRFRVEVGMVVKKKAHAVEQRAAAGAVA